MKKMFAIWMALSFVVTALASPVDAETAKNVALTFWNQGPCAMKSGAVVDMQNVTPPTGFSHLYIFSHARGFVIVAGDDCARPILAYSTESSFNGENVPVAISEWLASYDEQIEIAVNQHTEAVQDVSAEWQALRVGQMPQVKGSRAVQPLVTAKWGQGSPYNALCPEHLGVGCVAVAMGQIMHYWKHPVQGTGSHAYNDGTHSLSADFENTIYNWDNMPDVCSSSNSDVATLLFHCGVAVEMEYAASVSLAYVLNSPAHPYNAERALKTFFGYSNSAHGEYRTNYNKTTWMSMLKTDLDAGHPLIYNGFNSSYSGGHCFVCDGYDNNNYFHFNWGQNGSYDGYFEIDAMVPIPSQNFSYNQGAIFDLIPANEIGIQELNCQVQLYPNPTTGIIHLTLDKSAQLPDTYYQLYDFTGKLLKSKKMNPNNEISLSNYPNGIYLLNVIADGHIISSQKIIKK